MTLFYWTRSTNSPNELIKLVAYPHWDVAIIPSFYWPFIIFLAIHTFGSFSLLSIRVNDAPVIVKLYRRWSAFQTTSTWIEPVTLICDNHEVGFTSPLSHGIA